MYAELGFFLNRTFLSNNTIVLLRNIGEGSNVLFCLTNNTQCCTSETGGEHGEWSFPNGTSVSHTSSGFYQNRGYSSLILLRRNDAVGPTGVFSCGIPDQEANVSMSIGIYNSTQDCEFDSTRVIRCISPIYRHLLASTGFW